jgi:hypothetical protein
MVSCSLSATFSGPTTVLVAIIYLEKVVVLRVMCERCVCAVCEVCVRCVVCDI